MEYFLRIVIYGMDCSPWQVIRTLHQTAEDNINDKEIQWVIKHAFYMVDLL